MTSHVVAHHFTPLMPRAASEGKMNLNALLEQYAHRVATRVGPRPAVLVAAEEAPDASPSPVLVRKEPLATRLTASSKDIVTPGGRGELGEAAHRDEDDSKGDHNEFREEVASFLLSKPYTVSVFGAGFQVRSSYSQLLNLE